MTTTTFQSDFLQSQTSLNRFLSGDEQAAEILRATPSPAASTTQGRTWNNSWIDFDELHSLASGYFLTIASYFLHAICMTGLSKKVWVQSRHALSDAEAIKTSQIFQEKLLAKSVNTHRVDTPDYFLRSPAKTTLKTHPTQGTLNFFHQDGICRGMCHWFVHLYFKTRSRQPDADQHLKAIGQQFEHGASRQSAFLHALDFPAIYDLLPLSVRTDYSQIPTTGKTENLLIAELQLRPPGVYGIYTSTHQLVYIKINESQQYLFDSNTGVVKVDSSLLFKKAMERYFETHDQTQKIYVDIYTPR